MPNPSRQQRMEQLFHSATELSGEERTAFLDRHCGDDADLKRELRGLLAHADESTKDYLDSGKVSTFAAPDTETPEQPEQIGQYRILSTIGAGGMGIVYEAMQENPSRKVALKVLRPGLYGVFHRLEHEAEVLGRLQHPGIAHVYEAGHFDAGEGAQPFIAMERVEGTSLGDYVEQHRPTVEQRLELIAKIADAVHHAHRQGIIHRDLKPDNVLVTAEGQPKVLDFGIARAEGEREAGTQTASNRTPSRDPGTRLGQVIGTLAYMSPEQARGEPVTTATDVFALGVIAYRILSGQVPHDVSGLSDTAAIDRICTEPVAPLGELRRGLRGDVEAIVAKAIAVDESQRYESAASLAADLRRHLRNEPVLARDRSTVYQLHKFTQRNRALVGGIVTTSLAVVIGVVAALQFAWDARVQRDVAKVLSYRLAVRSAMDELDKGRYESAKTLLEDAPVELRGWEWDHAHARMESWSQELRVDPAVCGEICYTPDGTRLVSALTDGTIGVWTLATGEMSRPFSVNARIKTLARTMPADPPRLAAGAEDGRIFVWTLGVAGPPVELRGHRRAVECLCWAENGELFSVDRETLVRWRGTQGARIGESKLSHAASAMAVSPDGRTVVVLRRDRLIRWDTTTGDRQVMKGAQWPRDVAFLPDGERIVLTTRYQNLIVRAAQDLARLDDDRGHVRATRRIAVSPDASILATTSQDGTLTIRDARTRDIMSIASRGRPLGRICFHPERQQVACLDLDGKGISLWDLPLGPAKELKHGSANVDAVLWSPDGRLLVTETATEQARVFDVLTGELLFRQPLRTVAFADDSMHLLVRLPAGAYRILDLATGTLTPSVRSSDLVQDFSHRFGWHPVCGYRRSLPHAAQLVAVPIHAGRVTRIEHRGVVVAELPAGDRATHTAWRFRRDGRLLAVGTSRGEVHLWDTETRELSGLIEPRVETEIMALDFSPDGTRIAAACHDNTVRLFDTRTCEFIVELQGHTSHVAAVQFSPDGSRLASASGDDTARIWDSVPRRVRTAEARLQASHRARMAPKVEALLARLGDRAEVAARLRGDAGLEDRDRTAALHVLMRLRHK